jgi:enamine deaminase RidA (YjgF/YER057c/UK114 family)
VKGRRFLAPETLAQPFGYSHVVDAPASRVIYTEHPPASTLVEVSGLFRDDVLIEIEAVAIRESTNRPDCLN